MIALIRISGIPEIPIKEKTSLDRLRLRKKFTCVLVAETPEYLGMIRRVENFIAYGKIDKDTLIELIKKRGKIVGKRAKINAEKIAEEMMNAKTAKKLSDFGLKPFFALHPPRGGIDSKTHYPKGVLGNNNENINKLIMRML